MPDLMRIVKAIAKYLKRYDVGVLVAQIPLKIGY